jgi:hypothetical protein
MRKLYKQNSLRITAIVLLFIVSLNAIAAGYSFITDPSGNGIGISTNYLRKSAPFKDFLIPGVILFTVNGLLSAVIAVLAIIKQRHYQVFILMQGCILIGWIGIQLMMVTTYHPLHLIVTAIGAVLIAIGGSLEKTKRPVTGSAI